VIEMTPRIKFNVGDKVISTWIENPNRRGIVSDDYKVLGLSSDGIKEWKKNFVLVQWSNGEISGELKKYLFKDDNFVLMVK
jgi:hypothetical protein